MKRIYLPFIILGATLLLCTGLFLTKPAIKEVPVKPSVTAIRTTTAHTESITLTVSSRGKVQPALVSELSAYVGGPVVWLSPALVDGGYFEKGEAILRIDPSDFQTVLEKAKASKIQAEAEAKHAQMELNRITDLANKKLASESQLADAKRTASVNAGRLLDAEAGFKQAELNLSRTTLVSPFNAFVNDKKIELGQFIATGQSVATLYGADTVEVKLPLANRQVGFLNLPENFRGGSAKAANNAAPDVVLSGLYGGQHHQWHGKLVRTEAGIDASNNTVQAIVRVVQPTAASTKMTTDDALTESLADNDQQSTEMASADTIPLPFGLFVQAEIRGQTVDNLIALPRHVIRNNNQVLVVSPENTLHFREVDILRLENDRVLIQGGIVAGEKICLSPIQAVVDGMSVNSIDESLNDTVQPVTLGALTP